MRQTLQEYVYWTETLSRFRCFASRAKGWAINRAGCVGLSDLGSHDERIDMSAFRGPLRKCPDNPRYFTDDSGDAIYLTGSHVWQSLKEIDIADPPEPFDYEAYLDLMEDRNHNFMRMWTWDYACHMLEGRIIRAEPHPWARTGPGEALDGKPKFDFTQFDETYFTRLRDRVEAAGARGIYVSVMLFEGWGLHATEEPWCRDGHPTCRHNNVNGIDGDPDGTGRLYTIHSLRDPDITAVHEAYVRKVIDTVNDLDNVLYEICNETGAYSIDWQYHLIDFIHDTEKTLPKQHPVGMTFPMSHHEKGTNQHLFDSPADWISPNPEGGYQDDPPPGTGDQVIISDTDHLWGLGCKPGWVWKTFTRGLNPILMDPVKPFPAIDTIRAWAAINDPDNPLWEPIRQQMGRTLTLSKRIDLTRMVPRGDLASSTFCLANPGAEYVVHIPEGGPVTVDLSDARGTLNVEWFGVLDGKVVETGQVAGGGKQELSNPVDGETVVYIHA